MEHLREKYFLDGEELKPVSGFYNFPDGQGICIFEVLRVISGIPLFLNEHLGRLQVSAEKSGISYRFRTDEFKKSVIRLIRENQTKTGNIKVVIQFYEERMNFRIYFIPYRYPSDKDYLEGATAGILKAERNNPGAKTIQPEIRELANDQIRKHGFYDVLLVDNLGFIREGSRSNLFFIKDNHLVTPPLDMVLNGITRRKVIELIHSSGRSIFERPVSLKELESFDSLFLTGTSPKILPVKSVGNQTFDSQAPICRELMKNYDHLIEKYISENSEM